MADYPSALVIALVAVSVDRAARDVSGVLVFGTVAVLMTAWASAAAFRARVVVDGESLVVVNTWVTFRYPRTAIAGVASDGLSFLRVDFTDGSSRRCWAIQATNLMLMLRRRTRVDKVADEILEALGGERRVVSSEPFEVARSWSGLPIHAWVLIAIYLAMVVQWFATT
ncbi:hypothetical protein RN607_05055 [Demequina capsici]|uniref:Low molecular weight protein antigen 6 PH domain-containing protein n=1 Tax=Demequina capsici TaxID=3075620 RepID=A0AA96FE73_9MICO|nr:PH domain-containing protein [Demequina sp. PMTSA13]WNM28373.1 hypothetical protein RN607_05055 [Demequina sp. PMTSA13]